MLQKYTWILLKAAQNTSLVALFLFLLLRFLFFSEWINIVLPFQNSVCLFLFYFSLHAQHTYQQYNKNVETLQSY